MICKCFFHLVCVSSVDSCIMILNRFHSIEFHYFLLSNYLSFLFAYIHIDMFYSVCVLDVQ